MLQYVCFLELYYLLLLFQGYSVNRVYCEYKSGGWGQNVDCDQRSVRSACGSGFRKDCGNSAHGVNQH